MSVAILHISGPPNAGKTAVAVGFAEHRSGRDTYYLRLDTEREGVPALRLSQPLPVVTDPRRIVTQPGVVFETLAQAVGDIAQQDADATVIVETDNEPCFRHAYPWHARVFCLPPIHDPRTVFRTREQIAMAIRELMEDTHSFAAELFGLEHGPGDSSMLPSIESKQIVEGEASAEMVEEFLASDVGAEIACRMRLHSEYYAIMESDILLLSESRGPWTGTAAESASMLGQLLDSTRARLDRHMHLVQCNPDDRSSQQYQAAMKHIDDAVETGRLDGL